MLIGLLATTLYPAANLIEPSHSAQRRLDRAACADPQPAGQRVVRISQGNFPALSGGQHDLDATALPARCITTRRSTPTPTRRIITLTVMRRKILRVSPKGISPRSPEGSTTLTPPVTASSG